MKQAGITGTRLEIEGGAFHEYSSSSLVEHNSQRRFVMANYTTSRSFYEHRDGLYLPCSTYTVSSAMSQSLNDKPSSRAEFPINEASLRTEFDDANLFNQCKVERSSKPHVAFQASQSTSIVKAMSPGSPRKLPVSRFNDVTALDHHIGCHGGTTSTSECLPHRLRVRSKNSKSVKARNEELTIENGYLQEELAYHKDTREVLMRFFESINEAHRLMKAALYQTSRSEAISEQRLLDYWGIHHDDRNIVDEVYF